MKPLRKKKQVSLETIIGELRKLRREVSMFLPSESLDEYNNKNEIQSAYRRAQDIR